MKRGRAERSLTRKRRKSLTVRLFHTGHNKGVRVVHQFADQLGRNVALKLDKVPVLLVHVRPGVDALVGFQKRLLNYVLCRRDERISVEIKARDRRRIGDSASISQRRDRPRGAVAGRMTYFNSLLSRGSHHPGIPVPQRFRGALGSFCERGCSPVSEQHSHETFPPGTP